MKTEISRDSHQPKQRYSGVYQQQGRMLTDADWNELVEILKSRLNSALKDVVGIKEGSVGGTPHHRALKVIKALATDNLMIEPGHVYVNGEHAELPGTTNIAYSQQPDFPSPPPTTGDYALYADVWERTVTQLMDKRLRDQALHGADTCTRKQMMAQIKWCPIAIDPEQSATNPTKGDAELNLTLLQKSTEADPCDPCAAQLDIESKVGNYLFRVEVHDVQGDADNPTGIILKWSSENGAEQFRAMPGKDEMMDGFITDKWVYEFFDETTERHLGVHLNGTTWTPAREMLTVIKEPSSPYTLPTISGSSESDRFIRRWDGYCELDLTGSGSLIAGVDKGVVLSTGNAAGTLGYVKIGAKLEIVLAAIKLELQLDSRSFVAGDYWLAEVRAAEHDPLDATKSKLLENTPPLGIEHHYLALGKVIGGKMQANAERDRKYAFPALTEMTRMFHVGGDGQEAMPNHEVPQSLMVGVANGEWPVAGAKVELTVTKGSGKLVPLTGFPLENFDPANPTTGIATTDAGALIGLANCGWELGSIGTTAEDRKQRVTVRLVDPDSEPGDTDYPRYLDHPPIHFYANLSTADQIAYDNPNCTSSISVNSLLQSDTDVTWPDFDGDGDTTVKDVLDVLLCKLRARHIPYDATDVPRWQDVNFEEEGPSPTVPSTVQEAIDDLVENLHSEDIKYTPDCPAETLPTVRSALGISTTTSSRIHDVLNKLLCDFNATHLPIDRDSLCTYLADLSGDAHVDTVQDAINGLCMKERGEGCCEITILPGDDLESRLTSEIAVGADAHICIANGEYIVERPVLLEGRGHISIEGCGDGTVIRSPNSESALIITHCKSVVVRDLMIRSNKLGDERKTEFDHLNGALTIRNVEDVVVEHVSLFCAHGGKRMASCLTVAHDDQTPSVRVRACQLNPGNQQVGLLLVNANRARIEDNEVKVRPKSRRVTLAKLLKNKSHRLALRKIMLSGVVVVDKHTPSDRKRNVAIEYENRSLRFQTHKKLASAWPAYISKNPLKTGLIDRDLTRHLKSIAEAFLLDLANNNIVPPLADYPKFKIWFDKIKSNLPAIASQGLVCGGRIANDICITKNSIQGVAQGVHVGLSHYDPEKPKTYHAGRLLLAENRIVTYQSSELLGERHGIFIGNFECLHVENNHLQQKNFPTNIDRNVHGIRVYGHLGGMLQIRGNRLNGYNPAIFAKAINTSSLPVHLWQVENNLLEMASGTNLILVPATQFIQSNNPH